MFTAKYVTELNYHETNVKKHNMKLWFECDGSNQVPRNLIKFSIPYQRKPQNSVCFHNI